MPSGGLCLREGRGIDDKVRALILHSGYRVPGGEEQAVDDSARIMRQLGIDPQVLIHQSADQRASAGWSILKSGDRAEDIEHAFRTQAVQLVHVHNVMPMLMDKPVNLAARYGIPAVVSVHNHRGFCINGSVLRENRTCLRCLHRSTLPGVLHNCRGNVVESAVYGIGVQRLKGMWRRFRKVIFPSRYLEAVYLESGLVEVHQAEVIPHLVPQDPMPSAPRDRQFLYVGRNSPEKGLLVLLRAWQHVRPRIGVAWHLTVVTDSRPPGDWEGVNFLPKATRQEVMGLMRQAHALVVPSLAAETFSYVCLEALSAGTPVIASRTAALPEVLGDDSGVLVSPGDCQALADAMERLAGDGAGWERVHEHAAARYHAHYSPAIALAKWRELYRGIIGRDF